MYSFFVFFIFVCGSFVHIHRIPYLKFNFCAIFLAIVVFPAPSQPSITMYNFFFNIFYLLPYIRYSKKIEKK